jgi:hypothetical protein
MANPILHWQAEAIQEAGGKIVALSPRQVQDPNDWRKMKLDVVHLHWPAGVYNFRVRREPLQKIIPHRLVLSWSRYRLHQWEQAVKQLAIPIVWEVHDTLSHHAQGYNYSADFALHKSFCQIASGLIIHGEHAYQPIVDQFGVEKPYEVGPLGSYQRLYGPPISRDIALEKLGLICRGKVLSYLGTARPMRNPEASISAFIRQAGPEDLLLVAGGGVQNYLPDDRDDRVKVYEGVLSPDLFHKLLCASDFVINDGHRYLTSAIIRAAISYARPVIARPFGSTLDMAQGAAVWIPDTPDGLVTAIQSALKMSMEYWGKLSAAAAEHESLLSWQGYAAACIRLYKQLIDP